MGRGGGGRCTPHVFFLHLLKKMLDDSCLTFLPFANFKLRMPLKNVLPLNHTFNHIQMETVLPPEWTVCNQSISMWVYVAPIGIKANIFSKLRYRFIVKSTEKQISSKQVSFNLV